MCKTNDKSQTQTKNKECSGECDSCQRRQGYALSSMQEQVALILQQVNRTAE